MRGFKMSVLVFSAMMLIALWAVPAALAADKPQYGGVLKVAIAGDPPSLDMHQEGTFKVMIPMATCYNTLVRFDPHGFPNIVGDLAESWSSSDDKKTWTFKLHKGVKFHRGEELTAADVTASWERIVWPEKGGTVSVRKSLFQMIERIEAPDKYTVVFHLKEPGATFLNFVAHPATLIFSKKYLDQDKNWYKKNVNGTGPFMFKEWVRGSSLEVVRNPNYFRKDLPYLDGAKYFMIKDLSARAKSVRSKRTHVEFRGLPPAETVAMKKQLGDEIVVARPKAMIHWGVMMNPNQKPFDDVRVRKALTLAIDRYDMAKTLSPLSGLETVGGLMHPDLKWSLTPEELQELPGFGLDHEANVKEAQRLLAEAGFKDQKLKVVLTNRAVKLPYIDFGVYVVSAWKKIGVEAEHLLEESATWSKNRRNGNFAVSIDPMGSLAGDPSDALVRFTTGASSNYSKFSEPEADKLFAMQRVELDEAKRIQQVKDMQRRVLEKAHWIPGLWWTRLEVRSSRIKNYEPHHSHWMNRRLEDVWMAKE